MGWICDGIPKDGNEYPNTTGSHLPYENPPSATHCFKCELPREAVVLARSSTSRGSSPSSVIVLCILIMFALVGIGYVAYRFSKSLPLEGGTTILDDRSSSGERPLFRDVSASYLNEGIELFVKGKYDRAIDSFEQAVQATPNEPEPDIYLNNAIARCQENPPYVIAAVVPITNNRDQAKEMLRGVADAQRQFNQPNDTESSPNQSDNSQCSSDHRLLEVKIVDDGNEAEIADQVSESLGKEPEILAVIGHNSSDASKAAIENYESAELAMISPTSSSTYLEGKTFFRTLPSDEKSGATLAKYVNKRINTSSVAIFYTSNSPYSESLRQAFKDNYKGTTRSFDFAPDDFDAESTLQELQESDLDVAILLPSVKQKDKAIGLANGAKKQDIKLTFFGGGALYAPETLQQAGSAMEGMVLAVPWFAEGVYAEQADEHWQGRISWRTAMSYDAAQAIIQAIQNLQPQEITRENMVTTLGQLSLESSQTSGASLDFDENGDRNIKPILVQIVLGDSNLPEGSKHTFELVE